MLTTLSYECAEFLTKSGGHPLIKNLPANRNAFVKVKVRQKRTTDAFMENFNGVFETQRPKLLQRSVVAHGLSSFVLPADPALEPFYIFPIDGFNFMYAPVSNTESFKDTFSTLVDTIGETGVELFKELLKCGYTFDDLEKGISSGSEIIFYGIPYYYALRKSIIDDHQDGYENFVLT